jgi:uncharacterized protein YdeI (YjbR/CyaY-like superfamily)
VEIPAELAEALEAQPATSAAWACGAGDRSGSVVTARPPPTVADPPPLHPTFFQTPADFRAWLEENHNTASELLVGYYKKATGKASVTWEESVDEALCYGWIDGIRRSVDTEAYVIRFTPRKPGSVWSGRNIQRVEALRAEGRMREPGLEAYAHKDAHEDSGYAVGDSDPLRPPRSNNGRGLRGALAGRGPGSPGVAGGAHRLPPGPFRVTPPAAAQYPHGAGGGSTGELRSNSLRMECPCLGQWTP